MRHLNAGWTWRRGVLSIAVMLALVALAVDGLAAPPSPAPAQPVTLDSASSGNLYCPITVRRGTAALTVASVSDRRSRVTVVRYSDGRPVTAEPTRLAPGASRTVRDVGTEPLVLRWTGGPVVATWAATGERPAAAPCVARLSPRWLITGFDTTLGSRSTLHLFNPFTIDAVARVSYGTAEGAVDLVLTESVAVPAGQAVRLNLADFQPEQQDLAVVVDVLAGRMVAQGEVRLAPPGEEQPEPSGHVLLPAVVAPSGEVAVAYARSGDRAQSWLSVFNPGQRRAAVEVRVSNPVSGGLPMGELSVPAGGVLRVDLSGMSRQPQFGVSVASVNEAPVVVSRFTAFAPSGGGSAVAASTAGAPAAGVWGLAATGRRGTGMVAVFNPSARRAAVQVEVAGTTPTAWQDVVLGANGYRTFPLAAAGVDGQRAAVSVSGDAPIVAGLISGAGSSTPWTLLGVPADAWMGPDSRPPVEHDPALQTRPAGVPESSPAPPATATGEPAAP